MSHVRFRVPALAVAGLVLAATAHAGTELPPQRTRTASTPQADGTVHTLRQIPEACVRLQGQFGGAAGYALEVVPLGPGCPQRARFVAPGTLTPDPAAGWQYDEQIVVPAARDRRCTATLAVWKLPAGMAGRDGQGQARVYLDQARQQAAAGRLPAPARWTAVLTIAPACTGPARGVPDQA